MISCVYKWLDWKVFVLQKYAEAIPIKIVFVFARSLHGSENRSPFNETEVTLQSFLLTRNRNGGRETDTELLVFTALIITLR